MFEGSLLFSIFFHEAKQSRKDKYEEEETYRNRNRFVNKLETEREGDQKGLLFAQGSDKDFRRRKHNLFS